MAAAVTVNIFDNATPAIQAVLKQIQPAGMRGLNQIGSRAALQGVKDYHLGYDQKGGWFNRSLPTWGSGRSRTQWPKQVIRAWSVQGLSSRGFRLNNSHPHYAHKVYGGTISSSKMLTIPMVPEAHGRTVAQYQRVTGRRLFRPRGRMVLMERTATGVRTVYALKSSVNHKAWPGALPPEQNYVPRYLTAVSEELLKALDSA